jgi:hypothetical protein
MWKPKCCGNSTASKNITPALNSTIALYTNAKNTKKTNNQQINSFQSEILFNKRCYIVEKGLVAQDSAISNNFENPELTKEFICDYFDISQYNITKIMWNSIVYNVLSVKEYSYVNIKGIRYEAMRGKYFVGISAGRIGFGNDKL